MSVHAAVLEDGAVSIVDDVEIDAPRAGEARVRIVTAGVCGSDLALLDGKFPFPTPAILGHEAAGVVTELSPDVEGLAVGTRVTLWMRPPCRSCRACVRGEAGLCETSGFMSAKGTLLDGRTSFSRGGNPLYRAFGIGAFASEVIMPVNGLIPVPDDVSDDVAALVGCGVATGAGAILNVAKPQVGDTVLVFGAGGVGLAAVMTAAAVGAGAVIVVDPAEHRRTEALTLGATHAIAGGDRKQVRAQLQEAIGESSVDIAIDAVGRPELIETGYSVIRQGGAIVAVGLQPPDATISLAAPVLPISHKRILGCFMGGIDPQRDLPRLFRLTQSGRLPIDRLVSQRRPLSDTIAALDDLKEARGLRTLIDFPQ